MAMRFATFVIAFALAGAGSIRLSHAAASGLADPVPLTAPSGFPFPMASADLLKIREITERDRAKAREESGKLGNAIELSCNVTDAALIGRGKGNADGKVIDVNAYEVSCSNHAGYILVSQGPQKPVAMSCFAANARRAAAAKDENADLHCELAANKDVKVMAASLMSTAGTTCAVSEFRWFGLNAASQTDCHVGRDDSSKIATKGRGGLLQMNPSTPSYFVLDPKGIIRHKWTGAQRKSQQHGAGETDWGGGGEREEVVRGVVRMAVFRAAWSARKTTHCLGGAVWC